jgi:hypothetical protein
LELAPDFDVDALETTAEDVEAVDGIFGQGKKIWIEVEQLQNLVTFRWTATRYSLPRQDID